MTQRDGLVEVGTGQYSVALVVGTSGSASVRARWTGVDESCGNGQEATPQPSGRRVPCKELARLTDDA